MTNISYEYKVATLCGVDGSWRLNKPSSLGVASYDGLFVPFRGPKT